MVLTKARGVALALSLLLLIPLSPLTGEKLPMANIVFGSQDLLPIAAQTGTGFELGEAFTVQAERRLFHTRVQPHNAVATVWLMGSLDGKYYEIIREVKLDVDNPEIGKSYDIFETTSPWRYVKVVVPTITGETWHDYDTNQDRPPAVSVWLGVS